MEALRGCPSFAPPRPVAGESDMIDLMAATSGEGKGNERSVNAGRSDGKGGKGVGEMPYRRRYRSMNNMYESTFHTHSPWPVASRDAILGV